MSLVEQEKSLIKALESLAPEDCRRLINQNYRALNHVSQLAKIEGWKSLNQINPTLIASGVMLRVMMDRKWFIDPEALLWALEHYDKKSDPYVQAYQEKLELGQYRGGQWDVYGQLLESNYIDQIRSLEPAFGVNQAHAIGKELKGSAERLNTWVKNAKEQDYLNPYYSKLVPLLKKEQQSQGRLPAKADWSDTLKQKVKSIEKQVKDQYDEVYKKVIEGFEFIEKYYVKSNPSWLWQAQMSCTWMNKYNYLEKLNKAEALGLIEKTTNALQNDLPNEKEFKKRLNLYFQAQHQRYKYGMMKQIKNKKATPEQALSMDYISQDWRQAMGKLFNGKLWVIKCQESAAVSIEQRQSLEVELQKQIKQNKVPLSALLDLKIDYKNCGLDHELNLLEDMAKAARDLAQLKDNPTMFDELINYYAPLDQCRTYGEFKSFLADSLASSNEQWYLPILWSGVSEELKPTLEKTHGELIKLVKKVQEVRQTKSQAEASVNVKRFQIKEVGPLMPEGYHIEGVFLKELKIYDQKARANLEQNEGTNVLQCLKQLADLTRTGQQVLAAIPVEYRYKYKWLMPDALALGLVRSLSKESIEKFFNLTEKLSSQKEVSEQWININDWFEPYIQSVYQVFNQLDKLENEHSVDCKALIDWVVNECEKDNTVGSTVLNAWHLINQKDLGYHWGRYILPSTMGASAWFSDIIEHYDTKQLIDHLHYHANLNASRTSSKSEVLSESKNNSLDSNTQIDNLIGQSIGVQALTYVSNPLSTYPFQRWARGLSDPLTMQITRQLIQEADARQRKCVKNKVSFPIKEHLPDYVKHYGAKMKAYIELTKMTEVVDQSVLGQEKKSFRL